MGKIYRFRFPKYRSKIDPSDRSGTYILGLGMIAGSAVLSVYGRELAIVMVWAIGLLFIVGLLWEHFPRSVHFLTMFIAWLGIGLIALTGAFAIYDVLERHANEEYLIDAAASFGSALLGLIFFKDVIRGARASRQLQCSGKI